MAAKHEFRGPDGMARKIRLLASNCEAATEGMSRTLLIAVSAPDPVSTPDCEHASPRGFRIQTLDDGMGPNEIATLMGTIYGFLDTIEDEYSREFGSTFREAVDEARGTHGHASGMAVVPVEPGRSRPWARGTVGAANTTKKS
ncbi:MAG: hypothetical protein Tsb0013_02990 [Phycisphaerales bacterium]